MSRHQPMNGADSPEGLEAFDDSGPADHWCSACLRTIYNDSLTRVDGRLLCPSCVPESATFDEWLSWLGWAS